MKSFKEYIVEEKLSADTHEIYTAALVGMGKQIKSIPDTKSADALIDKINKSLSKNVSGASKKELESVVVKNATNYTNLAGAISASNKILERISFKPSKVFLTGQSWAKDIKKFQWNKGTIKDYNSSDIVVTDSSLKNFLGVSLKKKKSDNAADPTLINNAVNKFFKGIIPEEAMRNIESEQDKFLIQLARDLFDAESNNIKDAKTSIKNAMKEDKDSARASINAYLKSEKNIYFKEIQKILEKNKESFAENFLKTVFRVELNNLRKQNFEFALVLGVGQYQTKKGFTVSNASYEDINRTVEVLDDIFKNMKEISVNKTPGKINAWEKGAGAAKIFTSIFYKGENIIDVEIRYKGSVTADPQFFATATVNFKKFFK
jgi:hypothetical protein